MPKQIDLIERALDAYGELDTDQKLVFAAAIKYIEREIELWSRGDDKPAAKRGRPKGSKNRKQVEGVLPLIETNAATTEEL